MSGIPMMALPVPSIIQSVGPSPLEGYKSKKNNGDSPPSTPRGGGALSVTEAAATHARQMAIPGGSSDQLELPAKQHNRVLRFIRLNLFGIYQRLFFFVFIANLVAFLWIITDTAKSMWMANTTKVSWAITVNFAFSILVRQEHIINALFAIVLAIPLSWPLSIRRHAANIYHIGGLHSGCAMAAVAWFILYTIITSHNVFVSSAHPTRLDFATLVVTYILLGLLITIIALTHPKLRTKYHDAFEYVHRFAGWMSLAFFWAQLFLATESNRGIKTLGQSLIETPTFWLLIVITISIAFPWLTLQKVKCTPEVLSDHALRLYFDHWTTTHGRAVRISSNPLKEWHAFATVSKPGTKGFSCVISNAGDWTAHKIKNPPTSIWIKGTPTAGVIRVTAAFRRVVIVATGSGIGPCLSVMMLGKTPCRVLWSTRFPETTFGKEIIEEIHKADPKAVIHCTRTMGKPDLVAMTYRLYKESDAEAVVIISNPPLTRKVIYGMESRGIPAYGAIFDS
ncbi:MAG: hypothetical protein M1829_003547 [Trizodia sp. TS-e1964]|nr:MAG: hypothetical protein M1829_003547 [Trizodia sp. TS-e1964]